MNKFRKKPVVIEAARWFKNGDHPLDYSRTHDGLEDGKIREFSPLERKAKGWEGDIVRYYRDPDVPGVRACQHCSKTMHEHGWIDTLEGGHIVCPGDWIIKGVKGEFYPCKPDIFSATYEPAEAGQPSAEPAGYFHNTTADDDLIQRWEQSEYAEDGAVPLYRHAQTSAEPVATINEAGFSLKDAWRVMALPPGTKLYAQPTDSAALRDALKKARSVLESARWDINPKRSYADELGNDIQEALAAIDAAIAQQEAGHDPTP